MATNEPVNVTVTALQPLEPPGGPGITTSEFWKSAVVAATALLSRWLSPDVAVQVASLIVAGAVVMAYAISRGLAKKA